MNALNKLIQERFADITQGASADVYPLTETELLLIEGEVEMAGVIGAYVGTDAIDEMICHVLENRQVDFWSVALKLPISDAYNPYGKVCYDNPFSSFKGLDEKHYNTLIKGVGCTPEHDEAEDAIIGCVIVLNGIEYGFKGLNGDLFLYPYSLAQKINFDELSY